MRKQLYKRWWKWIAAIFVLFSLVAGLLVPVGPGIESFSPEEAHPGDTLHLTIYGYNAHFQKAEGSNQVYLRKGDTYLCATGITIPERGTLTADIPIPDGVNAEFDLLVNNNVDGTFGFQKAIVVKGTNNPTGDQVVVPKCSPSVSRNHPAYIRIPYRIVLYETIRNLFFHVPMWFAMTFMVLMSFIFSIGYLRKEDMVLDIMAAEGANIGILFGVLGFATGTLWGNYTWGNG